MNSVSPKVKKQSKCRGVAVELCKKQKSCKATKEGVRRSYCRVRKNSLAKVLKSVVKAVSPVMVKAVSPVVVKAASPVALAVAPKAKRVVSKRELSSLIGDINLERGQRRQSRRL
jgi:hypothetical protein